MKQYIVEFEEFDGEGLTFDTTIDFPVDTEESDDFEIEDESEDDEEDIEESYLYEAGGIHNSKKTRTSAGEVGSVVKKIISANHIKPVIEKLSKMLQKEMVMEIKKSGLNKSHFKNVSVKLKLMEGGVLVSLN